MKPFGTMGRLTQPARPMLASPMKPSEPVTSTFTGRSVVWSLLSLIVIWAPAGAGKARPEAAATMTARVNAGTGRFFLRMAHANTALATRTKTGRRTGSLAKRRARLVDGEG